VQIGYCLTVPQNIFQTFPFLPQKVTKYAALSIINMSEFSIFLFPQKATKYTALSIINIARFSYDEYCGIFHDEYFGFSEKATKYDSFQ